MSSSQTGRRARPGRVLSRRWRVGGPLAASAALAVAASMSLVAGAPANAADALVSQGKVATASSVENADYTKAALAVDGNLTGTRWSSAFNDNQWLTVDLGGNYALSSVKLVWEAAYASSYRIDRSTDGMSWAPASATVSGHGGTETVAVSGTARYVRMQGIKRATGYGYSLWEMQVFGSTGGGGTSSTPVTPPPSTTVTTPPVVTTPPTIPGTSFPTNADPGEVITRSTPNPYPTPDTYDPPIGNEPSHHEFQANCSATSHHPDDPIVNPGQPGASHDHTFMGSSTTDAFSTTSKIMSGGTSCGDGNGNINSHDRSGYWFPTVYNGSTPVIPNGPQTIYYKSGINNYMAVRPFPKGLRFVTGNAKATSAAEFQNSPGTVVGWECGNLDHVYDFPANCPAGSQLNVRFQAPSCWDAIHLDTADHKSHMAYPVNGHCPADHPVALPMLEFKMAFPVSGDMSQVHLASGRGYTWHYDFFNGWDFDQLNSLVSFCINGGLQCNPHGFDLYKPNRGNALDSNYNVVVRGKYNET